MTNKLWQTTSSLNAVVESYTAADDLTYDQKLVEFDVYCSLAHAKMLHAVGLIASIDLKNITSGLLTVLDATKTNQYVLSTKDEDVHTRIEQDLTTSYPQSGAKLHTGRSRNDQVLVDIRLYSKQQLIEIALRVIQLSQELIKLANKYSKIPMVGLTHMQPAMLSSVGLWLASFAESLIDDLTVLQSAYHLNDQSPLGSGAGYGVPLPLDRELTAKLLGFSKVQNNSLYCQNSKGKIESDCIHALLQIMGTLNKFATDCLLFTTQPFDFISFDSSLGTGSSIMPQKKNWDALELIRARYHQVAAIQFQAVSTLSNLPSGYNRDLQQIKGGLLTAFAVTASSLEVASLFVNSLIIHEEQLKQHIPKEIFATHWAYELMQEKHLPFREAYRYVKEHLDQIPDYDPAILLSQTTHSGSTGNLQLKELQVTTTQNKRWWKSEKRTLTTCIKKLLAN